MDSIIEATDDFQFNSVKLSKPKSTSGGNWLIKFGINNNPFYLQTPKCNTRNGILKAGKRYYTDLVFSNDNDEFIRWMENLENMCHEHLHENRAIWFDSNLMLERHDIENYFTSPMKIYKTGKYYILRVNVETNLGVPALTIYDEANHKVDIDAITDKQDVISILEFKGIKCSSTSFQIDIEMKQMVTIKQVKIFSNCVIRLPPQSGNSSIYEEAEEEQNNLDKPMLSYINNNTENTDIDIPTLDIQSSNPENDNAENTDIDIPILEKSNEIGVGSLDKDNNDTQPLEMAMVSSDPEINDRETETTILEKHEVNTDNLDESTNDTVENNDLIVDTNELQEFKIDLDDLTEDVNINIKKDKDIYYEMYREACRKAKIARDLALSSYLEAKRIKNQYMLDDLTESDDSENEDMEDFD
tara:strand:- start:3946 stop:5190 length:1245 start_codon:yes stop_codon:yes gene_type:complete